MRYAWFLALVGCGGAQFSAAEATGDGGVPDAVQASPEAAPQGEDSGPDAREELAVHVVPTHDGDAIDAPKETGGNSSSGSSSGSGSSSSGSSSGSSNSSSSSSSSGSSSSSSSSGSSSGTTLPCDGAGLSTHHTGTGLTWTDCVSIGTYDSSEAMKACQVWCATNGCAAGTSGVCFVYTANGNCFGAGAVWAQAQGSTASMAWSWQAPSAGQTIRMDSSQACTTVGSWN